MSLLVVGSVAYDTLETPYGKKEKIVGGSATYFSLSARLFSEVRLVSIVGNDFNKEYFDKINREKEKYKIDLKGLQHDSERKTFHWHGKYEGTMNVAKTVSVDLNVLEDFNPVLPPHYKKTPFIFLANASPATQLKVYSQIEKPQFVACDTMNHWIENTRDTLMEVLKYINGIVLNEQEALLLTSAPNLISAGKTILEYGPRIVVIKKGEHGSLIFTSEDLFIIPAYPLREYKDPTGAGDSFAGAMMGYLAMHSSTDFSVLKRALIYGTIVASFVVEEFGTNRLESITLEDVNRRYRKFLHIISLHPSL